MSQENLYRGLLVGLLDCGSVDLCVIENCQYDIDDIKEVLKDCGMEINLNNLAWAMFDVGKREITDWVENRKAELEDILDSEDNAESFEELKEELDALKELSPYDDIESYHNYLDTHVYIRKHEDIYRKYCQEPLDMFEENTGFGL